MSQLLAGKKVAFLVATEGVEQVELTDPWDALVAEHAQPSIVSTESGTIQAFNHLDKADVRRGRGGRVGGVVRIRRSRPARGRGQP